jgi:hypothetical protein
MRIRRLRKMTVGARRPSGRAASDRTIAAGKGSALRARTAI